MNDSLEYLPTTNLQDIYLNPSYIQPENMRDVNGESEYVLCPSEPYCQSRHQNETGIDDDLQQEIDNEYPCRSRLLSPVMKGPIRRELQNILKEIRIITDKIRNEVHLSAGSSLTNLIYS